MSDLLSNVQKHISNNGTLSNSKTFTSIEDEKKKNEYVDEEDASIGKNNAFPDNAFEVNSDVDGSTKYSFDTIYQDQNLINIARQYYSERDGGEFMDDQDVIDEFISDRTWKQANTLSMGGELKYVLDDDTSVEQKQRLAYLTDYWSRLPNFYAEGGRGYWAGLSSNIMAGMADPLNYVGGFIGGQVVKQGVKTAGKEIIEKAVQNQIMKKAVVKGTGITVAADATVFGGADAILQSTEKEIGLRENYDPLRTGYAMVIGAGTTVLPSALGSYFVGKKVLKNQASKLDIDLDAEIRTKTGDSLIDDAVSSKVAAKTKKQTPFDAKEKGTSVSNRYENAKGAIFDQYNPIRLLQEKLTGVQGSVEGLKTAYKNLKSKGIDPVTNPYFMFRMLVGSSTRADDFAKNGVQLMSDINAKQFKYTKTGNKGLLEVLKPFNDEGQMENLFSYVAALRSNKIRSNATKKPAGKQRNEYLKNAMFSKKEADRIIDFAELTPDQYFAKHKTKIEKSSLNFIAGAQDVKKFFDDILKYQLKGGVIDEKQFKAIQNDHPFYIPFYTNGKLTNKTSLHAEAISNVVVGVGSSGAKKAMKGAKTQAEYKPMFESSLDYIFSSVTAADRNLAKRSLYRMIDDGVKKGVIKKGEVVTEITGTARLKNIKGAITDATIKKLEDMGVKISKEGIDELDSSFSTMAFADTLIDKADAAGAGVGKKIDVFYDNGKFRAFIIEDDALNSMYKTLDNNMINTLNKISKWTAPFARIPSGAITHSPPFIAFNYVRDTLSGSVNSAFGFVPFYTTIKGGFKTMKGPGKASNVKDYINMFKKNDTYRQALVSGMGFSTRRDTEKFLNLKPLNKHGSSPATGYYKKALRFFHTNYGGLKPVAQGYAEFVSRVEYATRLGEFELAKKAGFSDVGAAFAGREIATDFGMRGNSRLLNLYSRNTMFFNAGLQGFYRGLRRATENPKTFGAMVGTVLVAPELTLWSLNNERREYEEVPLEVKQLNYLIPFFEDEKPDGSHKWPNGQRRVKFFFPIPKPYDFGVFANIAVGIVEAFQEKSTAIGLSYMWKSFNQIMPGSGFYRGDVGGTNVFGVQVPFIEEPAFLRPWADLAFNHDWVGAKITPYGVEKIPPELRVKTNTRESIILFTKFMKEITSPTGGSSVLNNVPVLNKLVNPIEMDYIVNSYMTGLLSYPLDLLDAAAWDEEKFGERPVRRGDEGRFTKEAPWSIVTKRFIVNTPVKASQNIRKLYEINERAKAIVGGDYKREDSLRHLLDLSGLNESYTNQQANELRAISGLLAEVMTQLAESRKIRDNIRFDKNSSAQEKRNIIEELRKAENDMAYYYLQALASADFDRAMKNYFGGNRYSLPKETYSDPLNLRKIFGVE